MGKRLILFLMATALGAEAQAYYAVNGACTLGGQATVMQGMASSGTKPLRGAANFPGTGVMASYPGCTVTVFLTGTLVPAPIYLTASGGARSNPFTADLTDGSWVFFVASACYDIMISSGATQASTMPNPHTTPGVCAGAGSGGGSTGGGTSVTVNGTAAIPNLLNFTNTLLVPPGSTVVNFLLNGNTVGAYVTGGGGGGGSLPTTPLYDLFASTSAGAAQASGVFGHTGFLQAQVITSIGDQTSTPSPFGSPNASVEYFPTGAYGVGGANGLAAYFSHSGVSGASGNGGIALAGGNSSGANYQIYLDCESAPALGCDFKVPITVNGAGVGGGGGSLPTIPVWNLFASTGSGGAQDSGVAAETGFLRAQVLESTGSSGGSAPSGFAPPNGSIEYFPTGATYGGLNIGAANGVAIHFSHSSVSGQAGNGGIALAGGNASGTGSTYQIYLDCEQATGCDFKVPVSHNGTALGGGAGGITGATTGGGLVVSGGSTLGMLTTCATGQVLQWNGSWGCATVTSGGGGSGTVNSGALGHFTWYATAGTAVSSNPNLDDGQSATATITSQEPIATPQLNVNGSGGIAMTGVGGTLPSVATGSGGIGIGPGGIPQINPNGTGWVLIPTTGGGATLPTIPATNLYASNGSGGAQDSNVQAMPSVGGSGAVGTGYIKSGASLVGGTGGGTSPFTGQNASQEWYGAGGTITPSTGLPVNFLNGAAVFMGHSASTAGATGDGGLALGGGSATPTSRIYLDCEVGGCDFKVPITQNNAPIGTVNAGTAGTLAYYAAAGTAVSSATAAQATTGNGIALGAGLLQFGTSLTAADVNLARLGPNLMIVGNGSVANETGWLRTVGTCYVVNDIVFGTAICIKTLPTTARSWILRCVLPWWFTSGTGTANATIAVNYAGTPATSTVFSAVTYGGASPIFNTSTMSASGATNVAPLTGLTISTTTVYTTFIDGVVNNPGGGTGNNLSVTATVSSGAASFRAGSYCEIK